MANVLHELNVDLASKRNLVQQLRSRNEIVRFEEDPLLASLCTCLGLEFEIGNPAFDRLTPFLGSGPTEQWQSQLVICDGEIGIRLRRGGGQPLEPRHPDLAHLLHPDSLDGDGQLTQALFFPRQIADRYSRRGFRLVIVRDWILNSALCLDAAQAVSYLVANEWEIRTLIAKTQAPMMTRGELAFFGTHDIVDHLFGADANGYAALKRLHEKVVAVFDRVLQGPALASRPHLLLAYVVGVTLDDLAQPRWYGSSTHARVLEYCLQQLEQIQPSIGKLDLPEAFHTVAAIMRTPGDHSRLLDVALESFLNSISCS